MGPSELSARFRLVLPDLLTQLLPALLRKPRLRAFCNALLSPVATLYGEFSAYYFATRRELSYNGQTMLLERALNDRFDAGFRRIQILNSEVEVESSYDNFVREQQPLGYMYFTQEPGWVPLYDYRSVELLQQVGFTVRVPRSLAPQQTAINTRIGQLKLALIRHRLIYFS